MCCFYDSALIIKQTFCHLHSGLHIRCNDTNNRTGQHALSLSLSVFVCVSSSCLERLSSSQQASVKWCHHPSISRAHLRRISRKRSASEPWSLIPIDPSNHSPTWDSKLWMIEFSTCIMFKDKYHPPKDELWAVFKTQHDVLVTSKAVLFNSRPTTKLCGTRIFIASPGLFPEPPWGFLLWVHGWLAALFLKPPL